MGLEISWRFTLHRCLLLLIMATCETNGSQRKGSKAALQQKTCHLNFGFSKCLNNVLGGARKDSSGRRRTNCMLEQCSGEAAGGSGSDSNVVPMRVDLRHR